MSGHPKWDFLLCPLYISIAITEACAHSVLMLDKLEEKEHEVTHQLKTGSL